MTLHVDYKKISHWVEETDNAELIEEDGDCKVLNLHANFIIPEEERHTDMAFPHLPLMVAMAERATNAGSFVSVEDAISRQNERPYRRPDFDAEWKLLKKAWSLHRRGKDKLANRIRDEASSEFYSNDHLSDVADWVWRFALFSTGIEYEPRLRIAMEAIRKPLQEGRLVDILGDLNNSASLRGDQYFSIIREYFSAWSEFSQVHFVVGNGSETDRLSARTSNFASTQMYYGNAFETLGSLMDFLTMINNVIQGRAFDQLAHISLADYRKSDKGKRFDAPAQNPAFAALCEERDNQLRNASHHRELRYDQTTATVRYNVGKGGAGEQREMSYADYLTKCSRLHHQIIVLLRLQLLVAQAARMALPI